MKPEHSEEVDKSAAEDKTQKNPLLLSAHLHALYFIYSFSSDFGLFWSLPIYSSRFSL